MWPTKSARTTLRSSRTNTAFRLRSPRPGAPSICTLRTATRFLSRNGPVTRSQRIGQTVIVADGIPCRHPAFDVTPARLIDAIYTERGAIRPKRGERLDSFVTK
ncbi:MAG: hypothetical protein R3A47_07105 [Polyangiales bacterium]